jgi:hypothetical protein
VEHDVRREPVGYGEGMLRSPASDDNSDASASYVYLQLAKHDAQWTPRLKRYR